MLCCSPEWCIHKGGYIVLRRFSIFNNCEYVGGINEMYGPSILEPLYAYSPTTNSWHLRKEMTLIWKVVPTQEIPPNVRAMALVIQ